MRTFLFFLMLSAQACLAFSQDNHPVSWKFSTEKVAPLTYRINFIAAIQEPYHIYPQGSGGGMGMPTEFLFIENANVELVDEITEKGLGKEEGEEVAYYKKGVTFTQTVKLKFEKKTDLSFIIKYMACNDQMCLPPSKKQFTVAIDGQRKAAAENDGLAASSTNDKDTSIVYEDFVMSDVDGKSVSSKAITSKSKFTFIDFWASWCVPCRAQGRALIPIYNKYKSKGLDIIAVSLDTNPAAWKKAITADQYTWTNLSDMKGFESEMVKKYGITAIPRNFLIDSTGHIIAKDIHGKELEAKLAALLN